MSFRLGSSEFSIEFNKVAGGTDNRTVCTSIAKHGKTQIFCSVSVGEWEGFGSVVPLSVHYAERMYAINRMPVGFTKRESKNREHEVLIARLVDRSVRPTIDDSFRYRMQVSLTVMSYDARCPVEPLCISAVSATLVAAGVPATLISGVKLAHNGKWDFGIGNHTMIIAGNAYGLSTIETSGNPLSPEEMIQGSQTAVPILSGLTDYLRGCISKLKRTTHAPVAIEQNSMSIDGRAIVEAYYRNDIQAINRSASDFVSKWTDKNVAMFKWNKLVRSVLRSNILWTLRRIDGRGCDDLRPLHVQKEFLPIKSSVMLSRGRTKVVAVPTISNSNDSQTVEWLEGYEFRKFIIHYNFLLGDDKVSRRDIGHGNLARNALKFGVNQDRFIRIVSEIMDSDGSSSMSTVAAACLSLKELGVMSELVAGVTVGMIMEGYVTRFMCDITAIEDNIGDMDLKIAGTKNGITAIQQDIKVPIVPWISFENAIYYGFDQLKNILKGLAQYDETPKQTNNEARNNDVAKEVMPQKVEKSSEKKDFKPAEGKKDNKKNKNSDKIRINLSKDLIDQVNSRNILDAARAETSVEVKDDSFLFGGKNISAGINKFLTLLYNIGKEIYYARVKSVSGNEITVSLLNGKEHLVKLTDTSPATKSGDQVSVYKGKFGRWTLHSVLD